MVASSQPVVIERAAIPATIKVNRELRLWMESPKKTDRGPLVGNPYTCPEMTLGSYFTGKTRLSLVDTGSGSVLNTIAIRHPVGAEDSFDVPYRIIAGYYYNVPGTKKDAEGKPRLLTLRDVNGDGKPLEFVLMVAQFCMGLETAVFGYSVKQDRVIRYPVDLSSGGQISRREWVDYLFHEKPVSPGVWSYQVDYRGRLGPLVEYKAKYSAEQERFVGTVEVIAKPTAPVTPP